MLALLLKSNVCNVFLKFKDRIWPKSSSVMNMIFFSLVKIK